MENVDENVGDSWIVTALADPFEANDEVADLREAVEVCASLADTLAQMHARGISHRDVKPGNFFRFDDRWYLGDFGLASFEGKDDLTR